MRVRTAFSARKSRRCDLMVVQAVREQLQDSTRLPWSVRSLSRGVGARNLPCAELLRPVRRTSERLVISMPAVQTHVGGSLAKLPARDRAQLVIITWRGLTEQGRPA